MDNYEKIDTDELWEGMCQALANAHPSQHRTAIAELTRFANAHAKLNYERGREYEAAGVAEFKKDVARIAEQCRKMQS